MYAMCNQAEMPPDRRKGCAVIKICGKNEKYGNWRLGERGGGGGEVLTFAYVHCMLYNYTISW